MASSTSGRSSSATPDEDGKFKLVGLAPGDTIDSAGTHKVVAGRKLRAAELVKSDDAGGGPRAAAPGGSGT